MKKLLPILLCHVLMSSQVYAISGGPQFGSGHINPVGTYSGAIVVNKEYTGLDTSGVPNLNPTALGLFTLGVPSPGLATGATVIFSEGTVFIGTIVASIDPDTDKLSGVLNAYYKITNAQTGVITVVAQANGFVTALVAASKQGSTSSARVTGTSSIQVSQGNTGIVNRTLQCSVSGYRQSLSASTATTITGITGLGS